MKKGIAIFGGTFDPPTNGHVSIVSQIQSLPFIEDTYIIPTWKPTYKKPKPYEHRVAMARLAFRDATVVSLLMKYTYEVIDYFKKITNDQLYFFVGSDWDIDTFKKINQVLKSCRMIHIHRSGLNGKNDAFGFGADDDVLYINPLAPMDISSTRVRMLIKEDRYINGLCPESVIDYIKEYELYGKK